MFPIPELKTVYINNEMYILKWYKRLSNLVPESSFPLTSGRKRKLWEQPFQACALDVDCVVKPDWQNSVISFVISKWLLPELSFSDRWSRGTKTLGTRLENIKVREWIPHIGPLAKVNRLKLFVIFYFYFSAIRSSFRHVRIRVYIYNIVQSSK